MKDKIISGVLGAIVGGIIVFSYGYFINSSENIAPQGGRQDISSSEMSDEQLEQMAERIGITSEELKEKIDSGEDVRTLMGGDRKARVGASASAE